MTLVGLLSQILSLKGDSPVTKWISMGSTEARENLVIFIVLTSLVVVRTTCSLVGSFQRRETPGRLPMRLSEQARRRSWRRKLAALLSCASVDRTSDTRFPHQ